MNKISIITPTYKRISSLSTMMLSLNNQENIEFDLIIVNDDPENKLKITDLPIDLKYRVAVINNENNLGPSLSRNIGVEAALTDWVCFLDDDDEFVKGKIAVLLNKIALNKVDVIYNSAVINLVDEGINYKTTPSKDVTIRDILKGNSLGGAPLMTIRKKTFLSLHGYAGDLKALEDYELNIKIIKNNIKYLVVDDVLTICNYRTNEESVSKSVANNLDAVDKIIEKNRDLYDEAVRKNIYSWIYGTLAYKSLLMNNKKESIKLYFKSFWLNKKIKTFILMILCVRPQLIYKLRSKL